MSNDISRAFVRQHRTDDIRKLALEASRYSGVDMPWALDQIAGWQAAREKLPSWAATEGIVYPPHLNMEQCSSEATARYKANIVRRLLDGMEAGTPAEPALVDLTGGFGVDFAFMAGAVAPKPAVYVEQNEPLSAISSENFALFGLVNTMVVTGDGTEFLRSLHKADLVYLDPARRDRHGAKTYAMSDCTPDVLSLLGELTAKARYVIIKLSPMLDWHKAVDDVNRRAESDVVREVHIVSVRNECKELLLVLDSQSDGVPLRLVCANDNELFETIADRQPEELYLGEGCVADDEVEELCGCFLYEPNASVMKAGLFDEIERFYHLRQLAPSSHLFVGEGEEPCRDFPGRKFLIHAVSSMNKRDIRQLLGNMEKANIATRNFPLSAAELRRRLKLRDGGDTYLFGTTLANGRHVVIVCRKT